MMRLLFLLLSLIGLNVHAASFEAATEQVKAQLIASVNAVHAGDEILIGVNQRIIPHWHTYWKNPGDSGLPTQIEYDLPAGSSAGEIQWATPNLIRLGPVVNFGYDNEVTLLSSLKISKDVVVGSQFPIKAKVNWLVCEEACIPQEVELALELPVVDLNTDTGRGSPLIELARANLPIPSPWKITLKQNGDFLTLRVIGDELKSPAIQNIAFYPEEWGRITHSAEQPKKIVDDAIELQLKSGDSQITTGNSLKGILAITENNGDISTRGYIVDVVLDEVAPNKTAEQSDLVLSSAMLLALLGGIILNLMPCVFPVLSIKALSLLKHAQQSPTQTKLQGLAYTAGILVSFISLGVLLILLKAGGAQIGWGFQFQSPLFVLIVAYLMFAVGLSLSGVFSIGGSIIGVGSSLTQKSGYSGSFFTGVLATIVATPCTAPFMGAALGFALSQPPFALLAVFVSLGFGLALPYLLLSYSPSLQRYLPKPGVWMDRLKQAMAFPMYAAAVWLVWVLVQQAGVNSVVIALGGMVLISFAAWLYEMTKFSEILTQRISTGFAILALMSALIGGYFGIETSAAVTVENSETTAEKNYEPYSAERLRALRAEGKPIFVNFTAAWCISCLVNEKVALSQSSVKDTFKQRGITYLKGDWTNRDAEITKILSEFGRSGVPLYLYYPAGINTSPEILPQILTPEIVLQTVTAKEVGML
jgi:thiol:disulfide interchange protein DsbD